MTPEIPAKALLLTLLTASLAACSGTIEGPAEGNEAGVGDEVAVEEPQDVIEVDDPWARIRKIPAWTGDLDGMVERGFIRFLTVPSRTHYFLDGARERGITPEVTRALEEFLNKRLKLPKKTVVVVIIPVRRDQLFQYLAEGLGDIASSSLTVTEEREELVDFADPSFSNVQELLVTGPGGPQPATLDDLSGMEVWVRESSSYHVTLTGLSEGFRAAGRDEIQIGKADEIFEDSDILEMVEAGLLPATVVDSYKLEWLWGKVFDNLIVHREMPLTDKGQIAVALRKGSPQLLAAVNDFVKTHKVGTTFGNILVNRYFKSTKWVLNSNASSERKKFQAVDDYFRKSAATYNFDPLMLIAQGFQESTLDQQVQSRAGAVGVMQLLPSTAAGSPINMPDISTTKLNIEAGVKYLRHIVDRYFDDPEIDPVNRLLFAFASYNAGPTRISRLRRQTAESGLNQNKWFRNVELVVASKVGHEPVRYVRNIFKYYIAYKRHQEIQERRIRARPIG